jgi:hypothetical protein
MNPAARWAAPAPTYRSTPGQAGTDLGFILLILANFLLYVRPTEYVSGVFGSRLYAVVLLLCCLVSLRPMLAQISGANLLARPVTFCVLALLLAIVVSALVRLEITVAADGGFVFLKVTIYFLLLTALVTTPGRLQILLFWLPLFTLVIAVLSILQYHGAIQLQQFASNDLAEQYTNAATGQAFTVRRLTATGLFADPNDLCSILAFCMMLSLYWMAELRGALARVFWLGLFLVLGYAIFLTQSRGGLLAMLAGVFALFWMRYGGLRATALLCLCLPVLLLMGSGRQTDLTLGRSTGQARIQIWSDALLAFRQSPLFGTGYSLFAGIDGQVAHNSFLHSFADLGLFGGMFFVGAWGVALLEMYRLRPAAGYIVDSELRRLHPYLLAALVSYMTAMFSLTLCYEVPTYTVLGVVGAYLFMVIRQPATRPLTVDARLLQRFLGVSLLFLFLIYCFVRLTVFRG